jgi:hypothetical protein
MDTVLDFIFPLLPAVLVFLTAFIFFNRMRRDQREFYGLLMRMEERKHSLPLQLKAYERLIIMLERITPAAMVMRVNRPGVTAPQLQLDLLKTVREEFELNVSMQMYISKSAWEFTKAAREEVQNLIKAAAVNVGAEASAMQLSHEIFRLENAGNIQTVQQALELLRHEARKMM